MFGFFKSATRRGKQLAEQLGANRSNLTTALSAALEHNVAPLDRLLRIFQIYCMYATTASRAYGKDKSAILEAAIDAICNGPDGSELKRGAGLAWRAFEMDEKDCRESIVSQVFTNFAELPPESQASLRISFNSFHQCTRLSMAGTLKDLALAQLAVAESPKIEVSPSLAAHMLAAEQTSSKA